MYTHVEQYHINKLVCEGEFTKALSALQSLGPTASVKVATELLAAQTLGRPFDRICLVDFLLNNSDLESEALENLHQQKLGMQILMGIKRDDLRRSLQFLENSPESILESLLMNAEVRHVMESVRARCSVTLHCAGHCRRGALRLAARSATRAMA